MAYYLVDYENVKADGMYGVDQLGKKDCVCIFYSENASTLTFGLHEKLNQTKGKIVLQKVEVGVKNALDFQLSTYLGYLISENEGKNETYYIVSEDKRSCDSDRLLGRTWRKCEDCVRYCNSKGRSGRGKTFKNRKKRKER